MTIEELLRIAKVAQANGGSVEEALYRARQAQHQARTHPIAPTRIIETRLVDGVYVAE